MQTQRSKLEEEEEDDDDEVGEGQGGGGGGMQDRGNQNKVLTIQITRYTFSGGLTVTH